MFFRRIFVILVMASLLGALGIGASAQSQIAITSNYCIFHVEASRFPQVEIWIKPFGEASPRFVQPDLAIYENGNLMPKENVQLKSIIPVTLIIAIDQGRASNFRGDILKKLKLTLRKLVDDDYLKDGRDIIRLFTLTSQNQTNAPLDIVYSVSDFTNWIDEHRFDPVINKGPTQALVAVEQSINKIRSDDSGRTPAIILFTHGVEDPATAIRAEEGAQQIAQMAQNSGILVFTIDTDNRQASKGPLDLLAQKTEGKYVPITSKDFEGEVDDIYQSIFGRYVVVYTSTLTPSRLGESEIRNVSLAADFRKNESQNSCPPAEYQSPPLLRPVVSIPAADARAEKIAEVTWPDGYTRTLAAVWCGPAAAKCQAQIDGTRVKYKVDASPSITITATIGVTDSFGLAGQGGFTLTPPPITVDRSVDPLVIVVVGIAGLSMVGAISWLIIRRRKPPNRSPVSQSRQREPTAAKIDSHPDWLEASLTILEGSQKRVIPLDKPRLILGRSPDKADVAFSFQSVSRIHCEILRDVDPAFKLINRSSTSGTWLNGRRIQAPVELKNGDEIVLGKPPKNGVKILFSYHDPEKTVMQDAGL